MKLQLLLVSAAALVIPAVTASNGYIFESSGVATPPDGFDFVVSTQVTVDENGVQETHQVFADTYRGFVGRHPEPSGDIIFRVRAWVPHPTDPIVVLDTVIHGVDNFANFVDPTATAIPYHAEGVDASLGFAIDGAQVNHFVHGVATYGGWTIYLGEHVPTIVD